MNSIIRLNKEKYEHYNTLLDKYLGHSFNNEIEEREFIGHCKNLLNEDDNEIEFEAKIILLNNLTAGIKTKKIDAIATYRPSK